MAIVLGKQARWRTFAGHAVMWIFIAITIFPLLAVVSISLRPGNFATGSLIPTEISLEHWKLALGIPYQAADGSLVQPPFPVPTWLWNSIKIATISAFLIVAISTSAAYAFARMKFRFDRPVLNGMLLLQMFPPVLALVAIYAIFETIPVEIEENAKVDGATHWQAFSRVLLPMAIPILMVVFVLAFIGTIIEYPVASILLREEGNLTLAVGSKYFLHDQRFLWGDFAAAAVLSGLPITLVFLLAQRWIVSGLTAGGVKG
jgi:maltose/maltodextrin transport system permease protein